MTKNSQALDRRTFIRKSLTGAAGIALLPVFTSLKRAETLRLGFIGLGRQSNYLQNSFSGISGVEVVAGADVYKVKRERFRLLAEKYLKENHINGKVKVYEDYTELLERKDIDAVVIASPDHWHARMAIDASDAGKDIYLEKPLTFTIKEGQELQAAVRRNKTILAVGSQQRSDPNFQYAVRLAQSGKLGEIEKVYVYTGDVSPHPKPYAEPEETIPEGLNWKKWIGPAPDIHYNHKLNPPISLNPPVNEEFWAAWRWYKELGGGLMTDWGAHMMDIAQWGLSLDRSGPQAVIPRGYKGEEYLTYVYENNLRLTHQPFNEDKRGVKFWGKKGWVEVARGFFNASDPSLFKAESEETDIPYEGRAAHHVDFIQSVRERKDPVAPVEIGHKTCVACTLGNIANELGRTVFWDPEKEVFTDPEASEFLHREYLNGYKL